MNKSEKLVFTTWIKFKDAFIWDWYKRFYLKPAQDSINKTLAMAKKSVEASQAWLLSDQQVRFEKAVDEAPKGKKIKAVEEFVINEFINKKRLKNGE